jgi:hypothetical protein
MKNNENDHGGTSLTAGASVSVSASDQLSHDAPKHTPGPWKVVKPFDDYDEWRVAIDDGDPGVAVVAVMDGQPEDAANAQLMAAAPEMYEALVAINAGWATPKECSHGEEPDYCDGCRYEMELAVAAAIKAARAAIAKAEGRS